jgi:hypothetical protein
MLERLMPKKSKSNVYNSSIKTPITDHVYSTVTKTNPKTTAPTDTTTSSRSNKKYYSVNSNRPPVPKTVKTTSTKQQQDIPMATSSAKKAAPKIREISAKGNGDLVDTSGDFYESMARFDNNISGLTDFNKLNKSSDYYNFPTTSNFTDNLTNPANFPKFDTSNLYTGNPYQAQYYSNPYQQQDQIQKRYHF